MSLLTSIPSAIIRTGASLAWEASSSLASAALSFAFTGTGMLTIAGYAGYNLYKYSNANEREKFWKDCESSHLAQLTEPQFTDPDSATYAVKQALCVIYTATKHIFQDIASGTKFATSLACSYKPVSQWVDKWTSQATYSDLLFSLISPSYKAGKTHAKQLSLLNSMLDIKEKAKNYTDAYTNLHIFLINLKDNTKLSSADRLKSVTEFLQRENLLEVSIPKDASSNMSKVLLSEAQAKLITKLSTLKNNLKAMIPSLALPEATKDQILEKIAYLNTLLSALSVAPLDKSCDICWKISSFFELIMQSSPKIMIKAAKEEAPHVMGNAINHLPSSDLTDLFDTMEKAMAKGKLDSEKAIELFNQALQPPKKASSALSGASSIPSSSSSSSASSSSSFSSSSTSSASPKSASSISTSILSTIGATDPKHSGLFLNAESVEYIEQLLRFCDHEPFDALQQIEKEQTALQEVTSDSSTTMPLEARKLSLQSKMKTLSNSITQLETELDTTQFVTSTSFLGMFKTYGYGPKTLLGQRDAAVKEIEEALKIRKPQDRTGKFKGLPDTTLNRDKAAIINTYDIKMKVKMRQLNAQKDEYAKLQIEHNGIATQLAAIS